MKKFMKITAITGTIFLFVGIIAIVTGIVFGGVKELKAKGKEELYSLLQLSKVEEIVDKTNGIEIIDGVNIAFGNVSVNSNVFDQTQKEYREGTFEFVDVEAENLEISVEAGSFEVKYHDDETVKLEVGNGDKMQCFVEGDTLKVIGSQKNSFTGGSNMKVYLPKDAQYTNVMIDAGMGNVVFSDIKTDNLEVSVGMGNVEVQGYANGDVTIECGMGVVNMELTGDSKAYNYDLSCGVGTLEVEEVCDISGIGSKSVDNGASNEIEVSVGMGKVEMNFNE